MATAKTTIELNGKLYDARTGKIINEQAAATVKKPMNTPSKGNVVDGFVRRPNTKRAPAAHAKAKLEKSKTLMRPAVKKPAKLAKAPVQTTKSTSLKKQDHHRLARSSEVPRSAHIQRFGPQVASHRVVKKQAELEVIAPNRHVSNNNHHLMHQVAQLATSTETHVKQSVDIIEESLRSASAHLEKFEDRALKGSFLQRVGFKNRAANIATLSFAGLLLVGFFAFQNVTNIEMRVAAARSGVSANMPGYSPAGFSASRSVKSEPGKVSVAFTSNTSDKKFTVTQQASNWSSDSLLTNHVLASKAPYQTYQNDGKTVYIYDNSNATWVNGGVWYRIDGNASLTSDQLLRLANSF